MGAHVIERDGIAGTHFAVWAPNARAVSVVGDFNGWREGVHSCIRAASPASGKASFPAFGVGALYKYAITPNTTITASPGRSLRVRRGDSSADRLQGLGPRRV